MVEDICKAWEEPCGGAAVIVESTGHHLVLPTSTRISAYIAMLRQRNWCNSSGLRVLLLLGRISLFYSSLNDMGDQAQNQKRHIKICFCIFCLYSTANSIVPL